MYSTHATHPSYRGLGRCEVASASRVGPALQKAAEIVRMEMEVKIEIEVKLRYGEEEERREVPGLSRPCLCIYRIVRVLD